MSYGSNWFKGCRELYRECVYDVDGHPLDFFLTIVLTERCRYNGNRGDLPLGHAFFGAREVGGILRASPKEIEASIKRLVKKGVIKVVLRDHRGSTVEVLHSTLYSNEKGELRGNQGGAEGELRGTNIDKIRKEKNNTNTGVVAPLVDKHKQVNKWEDLRELIIVSAMARHGYSRSFCEDIWEGLLAYDEGKPYKNRKSGAVNWFNSHITKDKWSKRAKTRKEEYEELKAFAATGGIEI